MILLCYQTATVILENAIISHARARVQVLRFMGQNSINEKEKGTRHKKLNLIEEDEKKEIGIRTGHTFTR